MKYFFAFSLVLFIAYILGLIYYPRKSENEWMDRNFTTAIKGFSILTVVWAHTGARLGVGGIQFIAGIGVSLFLICSGYGLEMSYHRNGLKGFWRKRLMSVCIPFWSVELVGLLATGTYTIERYIKDALFIEPATAYGWFMGYIVVCYLIFFGTKVFTEKCEKLKKYQILLLFVVFGAWFIIDSLWFAKPDMPVLRARQMLCFPFGILMARNKKDFIKVINQKIALIYAGGATICALFLMESTQLEAVKSFPYIISNTLALGTCFVLAIVVLLIGNMFPKLIGSGLFMKCGEVSYEIYLVHAFTILLLKNNLINITVFVLVTYAGAYLLHRLMGMKKQHGRINSCNTDKE